MATRKMLGPEPFVMAVPVPAAGQPGVHLRGSHPVAGAVEGREYLQFGIEQDAEGTCIRRGEAHCCGCLLKRAPVSHHTLDGLAEVFPVPDPKWVR